MTVIRVLGASAMVVFSISLLGVWAEMVLTAVESKLLGITIYMFPIVIVVTCAVISCP